MFGEPIREGLNISKVISGLSKTLNIANQAIPIYKQAKPMFKNAKNIINSLNSLSKNYNINRNTTNNKVIKKESKLVLNKPTFFN